MSVPIPSGLFELLKNVTITVLRERPADLYDFMADYFVKARDIRRAGSVPFYVIVDDDRLAAEPDPVAFRPKTHKQSRNGRRGSVSAERYDPEADAREDFVVAQPKTASQEMRLTEAVKNILLFR